MKKVLQKHRQKSVQGGGGRGNLQDGRYLKWINFSWPCKIIRLSQGGMQ